MEGQLLTFGVGLICAGLLVLIAEAFVVSLGLLSAIGGGTCPHWAGHVF